jgi:hypothetical protein
VLRLCFFGSKVKLPAIQEWIVILIEKGATDVLSKNTPVFIFNEEMLLQT